MLGIFKHHKHIDDESRVLRQEIAELKAELADVEASRQDAEARVHEAQLQVRFFKGLTTNLQTFGQSFGQFQGSLAKLASVMGEEREQASHTAEVSTESGSLIEQISKCLDELAVNSSQKAEAVQNLSERTTQINGIVRLIRAIADQTNLLALNAAIEAARAGESGRGFAVVADEVRKLAERTANATGEIEQLVGGVQTDAKDASQGILSLADEASRYKEKGMEARQSMRGLEGLARSMESVIANSALRSFVEVAKVDHLLFKFEIYRVAMGLSEKTEENFASHMNCRLGKWYYEGEGRQRFSQLSGYKEIEEPHKRVHNHGVRAVQAVHAGKLEQALSEIEQMEAASLMVLNDLEQLATSVETKNGCGATKTQAPPAVHEHKHSHAMPAAKT